MQTISNNIFSKFLLLLILVMGWGSSVWAQDFPIEGKVYAIKAKFANANDDSYLTNSGSLTFVQTAAKEGSYWIAERSSNASYPWRFRSVADKTKFLDATNGVGATSNYTDFNLIGCSNVLGVYHLNGRISNDSRTNLNIGTWGFTTARKGFGRSGYGGCWGTGHSNGGNPAWTTDYELVECLLLNGNTNIKFVDASGNPLSQGEVNFVQTNGTVVKISSATYNFGDIACPVSSFSAANICKRLISVDFDAASQTLTFKLDEEQWFTIKNHRRDNGYFSISEAGLNGTQQMQWAVTGANANTAAEYWCMKQDGNNGLRIYNKAYGLDYVLGVEGTSNGSRVRMYHVSEANATNTHFDKVASNTSGEFCIMLHSNHGVALHDYSSQLGVWSHNENGHKGDVGSAFIIANVDNSIIQSIPDYIVYKIDVTTGSRSAKFAGSESNIIGQRSVSNGRYMLLKSAYAPNADDFNFPELTISSSTSNPVYQILTLSGEEKVPNILHRPAYFYTKLATEPNKPVYGHIGTLEEGDDGMSTREDGNKEQKTSVFEIPVYLKPGNNPRNLYLPSDKLQWYQRWYNYETDGLVDEGVMPALYAENYKMFKNGHVSGGINAGANKGYVSNPQLLLPETLPTEVINGKTFYKDYLLTMDISRYKDNTTLGNDFVEPTLSQRVIYRIMDANKIATEIKQKTDEGDWLEKREIIFPCKKRGEQSNNNTGADIVPLDMDLWNYWGYNSSNQLVQLTGDAQITVELASESTARLKHYHLIDGTGGISRINFNQGHFITFTYPEGNVAPDNSKAILNVYFTAGGVRYNLAQFTLTFQPNVEPKLITDVIGKSGDGYISPRSPHAMREEYGNAVAQLQFDNVKADLVAPEGGVDLYNQWGGWNSRGEYAYPLDFSMSSYGYGYGSDSGTSRGEYGIFKFSQATGGGVPKYTFYPVKKYFDNILQPEATKKEFVEDNDYIIYVDAADQAGQVMSIPIAGGLCPGTRLFCYGWMASNAGASNPASVILSIVGHKSDGTTKVLTSYCPGILSAWGYRDEDNARIYSFNPTDHSVTTAHGPASNWGLWQQIGFSFMLDKLVLDTYKDFSLLVYNNCYNSSGGDYLLDNFQIFANPPKGNVDFTTPLCSDKVRHAKVHTDFDMLKNLSGVNESNPESDITATYCFLDAEIFDSFEEGDLKIADMFVMDDKGNHNLKPEYDETDVKVVNIINHAFRKALVGSRYTNVSGKEDHGFHTYTIPTDFEAIPPYAYNDSKTEVVYRETDGSGVRRLVFKENVVRGEMQMEPAEEGKEETHPAYWPYMRPSRTYYLVFSPILATQKTIDEEETATKIFGIHESCSFFGKFTTKDPLHVILDNADIESDLPVKAVCHGETVDFQFDMPALKMDKPIVDEEYCTSVDSLDGQIVPSTHGVRHYRFEPIFKSEAVYGVIKNLPYDWWLGGEYDATHIFRGTIEAYLAATHPTIKYDKPKDKAHKQDGEPVNIAQAMIDFRFFYPEFGKSGFDWSAVTPKEYNSNTGYGLLQSEINSIKDFVERGIIVLYRTQFTMSLTAERTEKLTPDELSQMTSNELNAQILALALKLDDDKTIASLLPLKQLEGTVLQMISPAGRKELTLQEFANFTHDEYKEMARNLRGQGKLSLTDEEIDAMPVAELRKTIEAVLRTLSEADLEAFAKDYFPNVGTTKRAHLVIRALNIMNDETLAKMTEEQRKDENYIRQVLRVKMVAILAAQKVEVLRKMWRDVSQQLTPEEREQLLAGRDPEAMDAAALGELVEHALGKVTDGIINELNSDKYTHFTLIPILPSQEHFVDEPYIFCPDPRGVKIRITTNEPRMFDGFAEMPYPDAMDNVPVRMGLSQIKAVPCDNAQEKVVHLPLRRLGSAQKNGHEERRLQDSGYGNYLFLTETDDPAYQADPVTDGSLVMKPAVLVPGGQPGDEDAYKLVGKAHELQAIYSRQDNFMSLQFDPSMRFREGYTYRLGFNFMEYDAEGVPTISCYGTMIFDMKVVPEYQKWTGSVSSDWTDDQNWARADRSELHAGNAATGDKIDAAATPLDDAASYPSNADNGTSSSFVPMYFTNVLLTGQETVTPELYAGLTPASRTTRTFLQGLKSSATSDIIYDMEVAPAQGDNFDCELFGTYVAGGLTFQPGAQLLNAQFLTYKKAWVEYELDVNRWYTLASPLQNTFAGEWYAPTDGGRQQTPHFYGINYRSDLNHRFQPAIYQRSWDSEGNNTVYLKTGTREENSYIKADWSHVYNDVKKEYSEGAFSVKVADEFMTNKPTEGKSLVRMPKADTQYTYYDINNQTGAKDDDAIAVTASRSRLWTDKLKDGESFTQTITNQTAGNNFFLVGNPFMTAMDMDAFFAANPSLEQKYWIISSDQQHVSVKAQTGWISTGSDRYVAPLQGFFVKAAEASTTSLTLTFTAAMQAAQGTKRVLKARGVQQTEARNIIRLTAERDGASSIALIVLDEQADNDYVATEDCETFIDGNLLDQPTVFTSAGNVAQTINVRRTLDMVPIGLVSAQDGVSTLRFDLRDSRDNTLYLFDSETQEYVEITDGTELPIDGTSTGRYYLCQSPIEDCLNADLQNDTRKGVWTVGGAYLGESVRNLAPGVYVVNGVKVVVR